MHDNIIQKVMRLFNNEIESIKLYNILRTIYWKNCFLKTKEEFVEKKSQKVRWRYFIDKPFQIRFIVRFFILILIGLALSLGTILLLDNFKSNPHTC